MSTVSHRERQIEKHMAESGVRFTAGRRRVVAALTGADGPRTAAELHGVLAPDVPLSSLYRSLSVLEESGVVEPHHGAGGVTRYELAEWLTGHHHHLVCVNCGSVDDIKLPPELESNLESVVAQVGMLSSFVQKGHSLEVTGLCARCA